jgi:hypothetical protein
MERLFVKTVFKGLLVLLFLLTLSIRVNADNASQGSLITVADNVDLQTGNRYDAGIFDIRPYR